VKRAYISIGGKPATYLACSSSLDDSSPSARHVFVLASRYGLRGHKRTYLTILESADHALFKMVRYVLLRPLRPELDAKTKKCLAEGELSSRLDEQANCVVHLLSEGVPSPEDTFLSWNLAPVSEDTRGLTLPFLNRKTMPF
jgi:hypothetical protein